MVNSSQIVKPIAVNTILIGVILAKKGIGQRDFPYSITHIFPVFYHFRSLDGDSLTRCRLVNNPFQIIQPAVFRSDPLPVGSFMNYNLVAGLCYSGSLGDALKWCIDCAWIPVTSVNRNMVIFRSCGCSGNHYH